MNKNGIVRAARTALHDESLRSCFYPGTWDSKRNKQTHKAAKQNQKKKKITYISQTPTQRLDIRSSSQGSGSDLLISDFELKFLPQTSMCLSDYPERISKEQIEGERKKEPQTSCTSLEMVGWE
jgi:hypothetical protein